MELKTFVAETLKQIVDGVVLAQKDIMETDAVINPACVVGSNGLLYNAVNATQRSVQTVEFDVSLSENEGSESGARIGVFFGYVGLGAHGKSETGSSAINRVKFTVTIILPS